jgi:hypothetical protein
MLRPCLYCLFRPPEWRIYYSNSTHLDITWPSRRSTDTVSKSDHDFIAHHSLGLGGGGELPQKGGGGVLRSQYQARYRRATGPNHSLYQSGFSNNYFELAAMNNLEIAYLAIHFYCAMISELIVTWKDSSLRWSLKQDEELCIQDLLILVSGWDLAEWIERLTASAKVATLLQGSLPASSNTEDGR